MRENTTISEQDCLNIIKNDSIYRNIDIELRNLLFIVEKNDNPHQTKFPDFIDKNKKLAILEHFRITSGNEIIEEDKSKGQDNIRNQNDAYSSFKNKLENSNPFTFIHQEYERKDESLENFNKSFKFHFKDHIESHKKFLETNTKPLSCYLIDSDDSLIGRIQYKDSKNWNKYINPCRERIFNVFLYNEEILKFIYKYKDYVDYVIFFNHNWEYIEYLSVSEIPIILDKLQKSLYKYNISATGFSIYQYHNYIK